MGFAVNIRPIDSFIIMELCGRGKTSMLIC